MTRDEHHVVDATEQPVVAVLVTLGAVAGEIPAGESRPVGVAVSLLVSPDAAQHGRPGMREHEVAPAGRSHPDAGVVDDVDADARQRERGTPGLARGRTGQRADHDGAGLGLPPRVDHRATLATDVLPVPDPRFRIDRLTDRAEQTQRREVVASRDLVAPFHKRADRGRRGVQDRHAVAGHHLPPAVLVGVVGRALVEHAGGAVHQRPVNDVGVPGYPADIGCAPVDVTIGVDVEHVAVRERHLGQIAPGGVHDAFGLRRGTARVEEVQQVFGVHRFRRAVGTLAGDEVVPPHVTALGPGDSLLGAAQHQHPLDRRTLRDRLVCRLLEWEHTATAPRAVAGDEHLGLRVVDAVAQGVGREAAEDHRVRGADASAREHGHRELGNHAQVDVDAIALDDPEGSQRVGQPADVIEQGRVGDRAGVARFALPVIGDLVAVPGGDVAVEAVVRSVELPAHEPLRVRRIPLEDLVPLLVPVEQLRSLTSPETLEVLVGLVVGLGAGDPRAALEPLGWRERPALVEQGLDGLRHG